MSRMRWKKSSSVAITSATTDISDAVKDSAVETMGLDPDRISVVRRGRDEGRLGRRTPERRRRAREELGLGEHELVVLTVGRQEFQKGQRHLVEAMPEIFVKGVEEAAGWIASERASPMLATW